MGTLLEEGVFAQLLKNWLGGFQNKLWQSTLVRSDQVLFRAKSWAAFPTVGVILSHVVPYRADRLAHRIYITRVVTDGTTVLSLYRLDGPLCQSHSTANSSKRGSPFFGLLSVQLINFLEESFPHPT